MVTLFISPDASETGKLLKQYLTDRGIYNERADAAVFYGTGERRSKNLNANCGTNKIARMEKMGEAGCALIPWYPAGRVPDNAVFPMFARKRRGYGGTDLIPVFQREELEWRVAAGWDWFSSVVPIERELRVWMFRGEPLDTFEKVMKRPTEYTHMGRNFKNGFDFTPVTNVTDATVQSHLALTALDLDFGAVDLLVGKDGITRILEVNTAPGVIRSGAQATLAKFADRVTEWVRNGYPTR